MVMGNRTETIENINKIGGRTETVMFKTKEDIIARYKGQTREIEEEKKDDKASYKNNILGQASQGEEKNFSLPNSNPKGSYEHSRLSAQDQKDVSMNKMRCDSQEQRIK